MARVHVVGRTKALVLAGAAGAGGGHVRCAGRYGRMCRGHAMKMRVGGRLEARAGTPEALVGKSEALVGFGGFAGAAR
jgi:hypothetical protein